MNKKLHFRRIMQLPFFTILALIISIIFFSRVPHFTSAMNLQNLFQQNSFIILIVAGQALVMLSGNFDLSVGAVSSASIVVFANLLNNDISSWLALILTLFLCVWIGVVNAVLVTICKRILPSVKSKYILFAIQRLPSIIITLLIAFFIRKILMLTWDGPNIIIGEMELSTLRSPFGMNMISLLAYLLFFLLCILLAISKTGKKIYMLGSSIEREELSKSEESMTMMKIYGISALLSGLAGLIVFLRMGIAHPLILSPYEWTSIAISIIAGICILGGRGKLIGVFFGVVLWGMLFNGLTLLGIASYTRHLVVWVLMFVLIILNILQSISTRKIERKA